EMGSHAGSGRELDVDAVPRRETGMTPYEVMLSESQERMLLVAKKGREKEVFDICDKWDLAHAIVGRVTDTGKLVVKSGGDTVAELPIAPLTDDAPAYDRPRRRPAWQDEVQKLGEVPQPRNLVAALKAVLASPTVASKEWVYRQYDHMVRIGTAVRPGQGDAAVVRFTGQRDGGVAMSVGCNSRWCYLDPRLGAAHAVAETARNVSCVGGEPLAGVGGLGKGHLGGSEYLKTVHGKVAGVPPPLDFARERAVQKAVRDCVRAGLLKAAHDCSDGGLAVAVAEMCFGRDLGCR